MKNCSPYDLNDYFWGELTAQQRGLVEQHAGGCSACQEELVALSAVRGSLLSVVEEEPLRRIAFVSDKVFEPKWWQRIWSSSAQLGFASAAMLSLAIVAHGFIAGPVVRPVAEQVAVKASPQAAVDKAAVESAVKAELASRFDVAVQQAVAAAEDHQSAKLLDVVNRRMKLSESRFQMELADIQEVLVRQQKKNGIVRRTAYDREDVR